MLFDLNERPPVSERDVHRAEAADRIGIDVIVHALASSRISVFRRLSEL
jgi:hypothetical protein